MRKLAHKLKQKCKQKFISSGSSDVIVVKWPTGEYKSTPFLLCFGQPHSNCYVKLAVNSRLVPGVLFHTDLNGYIDPLIPDQEAFRKMELRPGLNTAAFISCKDQQSPQSYLECQIYLYSHEQKLIISDVDGTLTKSDLTGLVHNFFGKNHIHNGYVDLIQKADRNGYKIVWVTMRSINLYKFSKKYILSHSRNIAGPLFMCPEQFLSAVKKQMQRDTIQIKMNILGKIREIFPKFVQPFAGGLGNRENDAVAYTAAQIPKENIFLVNQSSIVQRWGDKQEIDYDHMHTNIEKFFPSLYLPSLIMQTQMQQHEKIQKLLSSSTNRNSIYNIKEFSIQKLKNEDAHSNTQNNQALGYKKIVSKSTMNSQNSSRQNQLQQQQQQQQFQQIQIQQQIPKMSQEQYQSLINYSHLQ